jgi:tRNA modification GTPase
MQIADTIAAISSAVGPSPRGIVRVSGPDALPVADSLFHADDGAPLAGRNGYTRWPGVVRLADDGPFVPGEAYVFRTPKSFTRQDVVELHTVGGAAVLSLVLDRALASGARPAEPGEFTLRAFLAGAIDLTRAEGIAAVISAKSDGQLRAAGRLARGALSQRTAGLLDRVADLLALVEADIDFAEEPIDFISPADARATIVAILDDIADLLATGEQTERTETLIRVVLTGRPNAGKSTLLNRLSGLDRAICSPLAGTTRDVLTAPLRLPRHEVILIDGAGVGAADDEISLRAEQLIEREIAAADLVCQVVDITRTSPVEAAMSDRTLCVANKVDQLSTEQASDRCEALRSATGLDVLPVSAVTGEGCDALLSAMDHRLAAASNIVSAQEVSLSSRHRQALAETQNSMARAEALAAGAADTTDCAELLAFELREACAGLGQITGEVTTEDLLGRVFSRFCIGK